jgi:ankyrin repeat protein
MTALHWAAEEGHEAVVRLLLEHKADVDAKNEDGETALLMATKKGHEVVVRLLQSATQDLNAADHPTHTLLGNDSSSGE